MATISFVPATPPQDWNSPASWVGGVGPTAADSAVLASPAGSMDWVVISGGASNAAASVTLQNTGLVVGGSPAFGGSGTGTLTVTGTISDDVNNLVGVSGSTITADGGFVLSTPQAAMGGGGTFNGPIINAGLVDADGGDYGLGPLLLNASTIESPSAGAAAGTGSMRVAVGSTMELNAPTSENLLVDYSIRPGMTAGSAALLLDQPTTFKGVLDIAPMNTLDLFLPPSLTVSGAAVSGTTLTVNTSTGAESFALGAANYGAVVLNPGSPTARAEVEIGPGIPVTA